jgi:subtilisin family serine protease
MLPANRSRSAALGLVTALILAGAVAATTETTAQAAPDGARNDGRSTTAAGRVIDGQYIVVMKPRASAAAERDVRADAVRSGATVLFDYRAALDGFAARLPDRALEAVRSNPNVAYVEADRAVTAYGDQYDPPWGLDRIDQRNRIFSRSYHYDQTGAGVTAYIIDSGIRITHTQFGTRASHGFSSVADGNGANDCNGHGTHVAGTVGSTKYGVAKGVKLVAVRVLDCEGHGSFAGVIAGIDFVTGNHVAGTPAVANMSLGGGFDTATNTAVANAIADGVTFVVAAGNANADACGVSPASAPGALTVGATTYADARASYSNWGSCLDLFAPGSQVLSTWKSSDTASHVENGTSMASPHVAGVVATYLQAHKTATPADVATAVTSSATTGKVTDPKGSPNLLLYSKFASTNTSPPPPATTNLLNQPGFESGPGIWRGTEWSIECDDALPLPRTGSCQTWVGGYSVVKTTSLGQSGIVLPAGSPKTLRFWLRVQTVEGGPGPDDKLFVRVIANEVSTTVATYSNLDATADYVQRTLSLAAFAGKTVEVRFVAMEDLGNGSSFYIDDASVR